MVCFFILLVHELFVNFLPKNNKITSFQPSKVFSVGRDFMESSEARLRWTQRKLLVQMSLYQCFLVRCGYIISRPYCCSYSYIPSDSYCPFLCFPDLLLIFYYWRAIGDKFFVIHHLAALYAYYYVLVSSLLSHNRTCRQDGKETTKSEQW